jgi:hypothetical protein
MNCKPGDLAVLVRALRIENLGKFCTVLEPLGWLEIGDTFIKDGASYRAVTDGFHWWVEAQTSILSNNGQNARIHCPDHALRPIRPQADDADCESLAWLPPVPTKETVPA